MVLIFLGFISSQLMTASTNWLSFFPSELNNTNFEENINFPEAQLENYSLSFNKQGYNQCAGYAAAFLQRYYGQNAYGSDIYQNISYKLPFNIGVPPHKLINHFEKNNFSARYRTGKLEHIKYNVANNGPVIVLVGEGIHWQHYIVLLGYNENKSKLYFYNPQFGESQFNEQYPGNYVLSEKKFLSIWNNGLPGFSQLFITIEPLVNKEATNT